MYRAGRLSNLLRGLLLFSVLFAIAGTQGCKTHDDAVAASQQLAETAATMQRYFATLDMLIRSNEEAQRAQSYISGVAFDSTAVSQLEDTRTEIDQRAKLADTIARLSASFAEITDSTAASDAATAAGALNDQLAALKVGASSAGAANALHIAVTSLVNAIRAHDEVRAAKLMDPVLVALCAFYDAERSTYVSVADSYYVTASSNAKALIQQDQVQTNGRYQSSLGPFGLEPNIHADALVKAARDDMNQEVDQRLAQHRQEDADSAKDLGDALHRMQARISQVAKGGAMRVRVPPFTLEGVQAWIAEVQVETGISL